MAEMLELLNSYKEGGAVFLLGVILLRLAQITAPWLMQVAGVKINRGRKKVDKFATLERRVGRLELFIETVHGISQNSGNGIAARMKARGWEDEGISFFVAQLLAIPGLRQLAERDEREVSDAQEPGGAPK